MKAKAILFTGVGCVNPQTVEVPDPGPGELLIEASYTCISPGTELRCLAGLQEPDRWPFIPGYAMTGHVAAAGPETSLAVGTPVLCSGTARASVYRMWGGHVSHAVCKEGVVFALDGGDDLLAASSLQMAAIAYHGLRLSRPLPHERVVILGLGPIGQCSARVFTAAGATVTAVDLSAERVAIAQAAGVDAVHSGSSAATALRGSADIVVDSTGHPPVLREAIAMARDVPESDMPQAGARLVIQGSYPTDISVPYVDAFMKELTILIPRDKQPRDVRTVIDLMRRGKLATSDLIGEVAAVDGAQRVYDALKASKGALLTAAFRWQ